MCMALLLSQVCKVKRSSKMPFICALYAIVYLLPASSAQGHSILLIIESEISFLVASSRSVHRISDQVSYPQRCLVHYR